MRSPVRRATRFLRAGAAAVLLAFAHLPVHADSLHDPALRFRTLRTPHFVVYYHQGEAAIARRLGAIAEETWRRLAARLGPVPPRRTHVVLVDETELANGSANPLPRDTIVVTAAWPSGSEYIGNTDDWLQLVFTHEFTHIVHLDRSESWARLVRGLFGRAPLAFPNLFLPIWQIEGLAEYEESVITGEGRLHAGDFQQITDGAARAAATEPIDRTNGGLTDWPGGLAAYAYGLGFYDYLADRFGADRFRELADRTARRVPYTASRVFKQIYGESLGDLWRDYERSLQAAHPAVGPAAPTGPRRLTSEGFYAAGPRFAGDSIVYALDTPHNLPSLNRVPVAGGRSERLATRYLGSTSGVGRGIVYYDQQEFRRNEGLYSDLYSIDLATRRVRQLTREARLLDPDLSPDGRTLVAVQAHAGRRDLVTIGLKADGTCGPVTVIQSGPEIQFNAPRWSPDGRLVASERHGPGTLSDVVVVDVATTSTVKVVSRPYTRVVTPSWSRDGTRVIVAAAAENATFELFDVALDAGTWRQITSVAGGAFWPDVSPDGRTIVYVGYTDAGFDLFETAYQEPGGPGLEARGASAPTSDLQPAAPDVQSPGSARDYSPWPTLFPTSWTPVLTGDRHAVRFGAATGGFDVLGYHAWSATATWLAYGPAGAPLPPRFEPDWQVAYAYARWRPTLFGAASSDTSFYAGPPTAAGTTSEVTLQEQQIEAGVLLPIRHVRASHTALFALVRAIDNFTFYDGSSVALTRAALRAGWATTTAHLFGYSISPERGVTFGATAERVAPALGSSGEANAITGDLRVYAPAFGRHDVFAIRLAGGTSSGDLALRRAFHLGGAGPNADPLDFGYNAISLMRGFPIDTFAGSNVALLNADYRFPIARIERGWGTLPVFLHTLQGAVFADAGQAWTGTFRIGDAKTSVGAELSSEIVAGYWLPFTATAGIAYGRDGSHTFTSGTTIYVRVGYAF